jgi:hypothetical protein
VLFKWLYNCIQTTKNIVKKLGMQRNIKKAFVNDLKWIRIKANNWGLLFTKCLTINLWLNQDILLSTKTFIQMAYNCTLTKNSNCESKDTHFWKAFVQTTKELRVIADSWG